jgi:hypothetical protein
LREDAEEILRSWNHTACSETELFSEPALGQLDAHLSQMIEGWTRSSIEYVYRRLLQDGHPPLESKSEIWKSRIAALSSDAREIATIGIKQLRLQRNGGTLMSGNDNPKNINISIVSGNGNTILQGSTSEKLANYGDVDDRVGDVSLSLDSLNHLIEQLLSQTENHPHIDERARREVNDILRDLQSEAELPKNDYNVPKVTARLASFRKILQDAANSGAVIHSLGKPALDALIKWFS